ncbi:MAG: hypothetical protein K9M07_02395 [Simkaniaceae bacterium]|nr:hypothetical protein [Simkaniaceae bacterium]
MKAHPLLILASFLSMTYLQSAIKTCFFIPPKNWVYCDQKSAEKKETIAFVSPKKLKTITPTIAYDIKPNSVSANDYVKSALKLLNQDRNHTCISLGSLQIDSHHAELLQIDQKMPIGKVTLLQLVIFDQDTVHILSAPTLESDFHRYDSDILETFKSAQLISSPLDVLNHAPLLRSKLSSAMDSFCSTAKQFQSTPLKLYKNALISESKQIESILLNDCKEYGTYFPILTINYLNDYVQNLSPTPDVVQNENN